MQLFFLNIAKIYSVNFYMLNLNIYLHFFDLFSCILQMDFTFISDIENGKKWVSPETIEKLSKFLDVEVYQFFLPEDYVFQEDKSIESFANEINESIRKIELRYLGK